MCQKKFEEVDPSPLKVDAAVDVRFEAEELGVLVQEDGAELEAVGEAAPLDDADAVDFDRCPVDVGVGEVDEGDEGAVVGAVEEVPDEFLVPRDAVNDVESDEVREVPLADEFPVRFGEGVGKERVDACPVAAREGVVKGVGVGVVVHEKCECAKDVLSVQRTYVCACIQKSNELLRWIFIRARHPRWSGVGRRWLGRRRCRLVVGDQGSHPHADEDQR